MSPPPRPADPTDFAVYRDEATAVAERLEEVALISSKRIDLLDVRATVECRSIARELRQLGRNFDSWPYLDDPTREYVRKRDVPRLLTLMRRGLEILRAAPKGGLLGPVGRR